MLKSYSSSPFIRCSIYTGVLPGGGVSPGFVPVHDENMFPSAWVVPTSILNARDVRDYSDNGVPADGPVEEARWAADNVRLVQLIFPGPIHYVSPTEYEVLVTAPFDSSMFGLVDRKRGGDAPHLSVYEGDRLSDIFANSLVNMEVSLPVRMQKALEHFRAGSGYYRGKARVLNEFKFPKKGDRWS